jgi:hypothetical protein
MKQTKSSDVIARWTLATSGLTVKEKQELAIKLLASSLKRSDSNGKD